jgi:hypothetical protein
MRLQPGQTARAPVLRKLDPPSPVEIGGGKPSLRTNAFDVADRKSEQAFSVWHILSARKPFLTISSFPNFLEKITLTKVHPCSRIWIERLCHGRHAKGRYC